MTHDLDLLLQQLADENRAVHTIKLAGLSDLPRSAAATVYAALARLSARRRLDVVRAMTEQAEANVHLNFLAILRECLADSAAEVRKVAIDGLWEDERPTLVAPLARLLAEDESPEVRAAAAISLSRFVLLGVLGEISDVHAQRAAQAMRTAWSRPGEVVEVRRRALEGLAYTDEDGVEDLIEAAYYDENALMRQSALFAMGRTADRRWARVVLTELGSREPAMRYEAAGAAGELGLTAAVRPLIKLLDDADGAVREMAAAALGKVGGREARRALEACLQSGDRSLADAAADALDELAFNSESLDVPLMDYRPRSGAPADDDDDRDDEFADEFAAAADAADDFADDWEDADFDEEDAWDEDGYGADEDEAWDAEDAEADDDFGEDAEADDDFDEADVWPARR